MGQPVLYFEIITPNMKESGGFYAALFGWEVSSANDPNYSIAMTGGDNGVFGGIGQAEKAGDERVTVYVGVDDVQAYLDEAEKLGGKTVQPPTDIPGYGTVALFADPAGQVTGLWKRA
jgi:predicted enzyme related to lactoylglutathione lyase